MDKTSRAIILIAACVLFPRANGESACAMKYQKFPGHTACIADASPKAEPQLFNDEEKAAIVEQHNTIRGGVTPPPINMMKLYWDDELAMIAQKWTDTCQKGHDKNIHRFIPGQLSVGQNMAFGQKSITEAIQNWAGEATDYTYNKKNSEHKDMIGHYTQIAWAESVKIGCGRATCDGIIHYTCNYGPGGNMGDFETPYKTGGTPGSGCKTADNGLCDCKGKVCWNGKQIDPMTCECDCGDQYLVPECSLNCGIDDPTSCGNGYFAKDECQKKSFVTSSCPKQCELCPYATKDYVEDGDGDKDQDEGKDENKDQDEGKDENKDQGEGKDENKDQGEGKDDDGGASAIDLCMALFILSLLIACPRMF